MSNLSFEQKQACRTNPLAAYLAKRLSWMLLLVVVINLCSIGLAAMGAVYTVRGGDPGLAATMHLWAFVLMGLNLISGLVLAYELLWMRQHQISPDSFCEVIAEAAETEDWSKVGAFHAKGLFAEWRSAVAECRRFSSYCANRHREASTAMEKDYLRSMEIQAKATADLVEALSLSMEEKQQLGFHGSQVGFRQKEMTVSALQRVTRVAQEAIRSVNGKRRHKALAK